MTYLALFSRISCFTWSGHCKELNLIGNLSEILTVGRWTHKQQKDVANLFFRTIFSKRAIFVQTLQIFVILFRKRSIKVFTVTEYGKTQIQFFSALGPETEEQIKLAREKIRFLTLKRWFGRSHLEVVKNSTIHFISKLLV